MNEVLRQEKKYLINIMDVGRMSGFLEKVMSKDEHNGYEGYAVRSLYFDTIDNMDFWDKINGIEKRRKMRLRIYGSESQYAMFEMKQKEGMYQKKRSLKVSREDAESLSNGDYYPLLKYSDPFAAECYGLLNSFCYKPKAIVEYKRKAYIAKENHIRVTLDFNIMATEACYDIFSPNLKMYPALDRFNAVMEVKYNGFLLSYIKDLLNSVNKSETSVSKYCLARGACLKYYL
mgnify:FL=1